jgi:phosphoribosylformimino-5-aminoimidazole carboxamide ribotide isomerase
MDLYPAIDLRGGRCVRLVEGDFDRETVYGDDPVAVARGFAGEGARWIHVVDLDAARTGVPANTRAVEAVAGLGAPGVSVQASGGVRSLEAAERLFACGVARVVIGTAAVEAPGLLAEAAARWPGRVAAGLDHRGGEVMVRGWTAGSGRRLSEVLPALADAGAAAVVVTDISRDGTMSGPDVEGLAALAAAAGVPLIASGGVSSLEDLSALASVPGLAGVIVGRALYEGRFGVADALSVLREARP